MAAIVRIGLSEATCDGYIWTSEDETLALLLNARMDPWGPSGSDPNPDCSAAQQAVEDLGGELLQCDEAEELPEGAIA